eukprot:jgi/Picre1/34707/NNA_002175.t1
MKQLQSTHSWLTLKRIEWVDPVGRSRFWESVERRTTASSGVDAVAVVARAVQKNKEPQALVISQYRPAVGSNCLEMPAGLIDEGEDAGVAAIRELKEETGYHGKILTVTPVCFNDPGITNANMMMAVVEIDLDSEENRNVSQELHDGEFISVEFAPGMICYRGCWRGSAGKVSRVHGGRKTHGFLVCKRAGKLNPKAAIAVIATGIALISSLLLRKKNS